MSTSKEHMLNLSKEVEQHNEAMEANPHYKEIIQTQHSFAQGKKFMLEVEVTDPDMSSFLMRWLSAKDKNGECMQYFGCRLHVINYGNPKEDMKEKLLEFINSL